MSMCHSDPDFYRERNLRWKRSPLLIGLKPWICCDYSELKSGGYSYPKLRSFRTINFIFSYLLNKKIHDVHREGAINSTMFLWAFNRKDKDKDKQNRFYLPKKSLNPFNLSPSFNFLSPVQIGIPKSIANAIKGVSLMSTSLHKS